MNKRTVGRPIRGGAVLVVALLAVMAAAIPALAKSYRLPDAQISVRVNPDGSLDITENITFDFDGEFHGAYRDIPFRFGERAPLESISVAEGGRSYRPGGNTTLGAPGPSNTFATAYEAGGARIVWRYDAEDERRTFRIGYRMVGLVKVYDDVADLNLRVWGDEWPVSLDRLRVDLSLPGAVTAEDLRLRVWGHPPYIQGSVGFTPERNGATLDASDIRSGRWVEIRLLFPSELLTSADGGRRETGAALDRIVAEQETADSSPARDAQEAAEGQRRVDEAVHWVRQNLWWLIPLVVVLAIGPALAIFGGIGLLFGRDRSLPGAPDYQREIPSDDSPVLVGALVEEGTKTGTDEFLAAFFDLIRRAYYSASHEVTEKTRMFGLRTESIADLRIRRTDKSPDDLFPWDRTVFDAVEPAIESEGTLLSDLSDRLRDDAEAFYQKFQEFRKEAKDEVRHRGWVDRSGRLWWVFALVVLLMVGVLSIFIVAGRPNLGAVLLLTIPAFSNGVVLLILGLAIPRALLRRSPEAAGLAAKWRALARYLGDFSLMQQAPPGSLVLWEQFLIYGIVLGQAERVVEAAHLIAPSEVVRQSSLYWFDGHTAGVGTGLTHLNLSRLMWGINRAVASGAPSSSSSGSGFGGGFSGGGGGGGGGGAW